MTNLHNITAKDLQYFLKQASKQQLASLLGLLFANFKENQNKLKKFADEMRATTYGKKIYFRALVEISSYCKNGCYYCGLNSSNRNATRYRLTEQQILDVGLNAKNLGFSTLVLQGGEDNYFDDLKICHIIENLKKQNENTAITLSLGEKTKESFKMFFDAGADRYLLRHETADKVHYQKLHPAKMDFENRKRCLFDLKDIGYQTGSGIMVDSPFQTLDTIAQDLIFLRELQPEMIGIGVFIPTKNTKFENFQNPKIENTLVLLSLLRVLFPKALLPSTTALGSVQENGRIEGLNFGASVLMPNLSPKEHKKDYAIYDNKASSGLEDGNNIENIKLLLKQNGFVADMSKGDYLGFEKSNAKSKILTK